MDVFPRDGCCRLTTKRWNACANLVQDHAKRVDIATFVTHLALSLFRRIIQRGAKPRATDSTGGNSYQPGNAKVCEYRLAHRVEGCVAGIEQDIGGFDVTVKHA